MHQQALTKRMLIYVLSVIVPQAKDCADHQHNKSSNNSNHNLNKKKTKNNHGIRSNTPVIVIRKKKKDVCYEPQE